ncbi:MAG: GNAT family N-acetyltransferase [Polaromonas sp.]
MIQWNSANASVNAPDLSLVGPVPLELDPRWLSSRVNGVNKYVRYFMLGDQQRPRGYAPFIVHQGALAYCFGEVTVFRIPVLRYAMQGAPLCDNDEMLAGLFAPLSQAVGKRGVVFFEGIPAGSPLADLLTSPTSPVCEYFHVVPYGPVYARRLIELPAGAQFDDYLQTIGTKKSQYNIRSMRKSFGAKARGQVRIARYTEPAQASDLATAVAQISRKTYQYHLLGLGLENTPEHIAQLRVAADGGWLRAYVLWIGDTPVAFALGYHDADTYYVHHLGYDPDVSKLQPGIYLHTEIMADLLASGICRFDFLSGDSLYKQRMSNTLREERHYYLIPRGWPGTVYARTLLIVNSLSEAIGRWLDKSGLKERIRRLVRSTVVKRATHGN